MLAWNQLQVQKLSPGEIWLFILGRVLLALGLGILPQCIFQKSAGSLCFH